jgi:hypothetical protein
MFALKQACQLHAAWHARNRVLQLFIRLLLQPIGQCQGRGIFLFNKLSQVGFGGLGWAPTLTGQV